MKKIYSLFSIVLLVFVISGFRSIEEVTTTPTNFACLVSKKWKLFNVEVNGNFYSDAETTDLEFLFKDNGTFRIGSDTINIHWQFQDPAQKQIVINQGTTAQQVWNIRHIDPDLFIYDVNYTIEGISYNYVFRFMGYPIP